MPLIRVMALLSLGWGAVAAAQPAGAAPDCTQALSRLDTLRRERGTPEAIEAARQAASRACLGTATPAVPASRPKPLRPAPVMPVPGLGRLPPPPAIAAPAVPSAPVEIGRPTFLSHCDAGGCRDPQGRYVPRAGAVTPGVNGPCLPQGDGAVCP